MASPPRTSPRVNAKHRASLVINLERNQKRVPCLVVDSSKHGFRLRGIPLLRRGQLVELILEENLHVSQRCRVVWVGKAGSKEAGDVGLEVA
jgi:hypothetical protein